MQKLINKVFGERVSVVLYLLVLLLKVISSHSKANIKLFQFLIFIAVGAIGVMSIKGKKIASVIIGVLIVITGGATLIISFLIGLQQFSLKILFIVIGVYFLIGGVIVFKKGIAIR